MVTRTQSLLIYGMLVTLYLSSEIDVAGTDKLVVDGVQNLSVQALLQGQGIAARKEAYKFLKLNISWLPPNSIRQPSSYSILVTSVSRKSRTSTTECPEGTFFHTSMTNEKLYVLVPANNSLADISDLYIKPGCPYKVQVIANPRSKHMVNVSEIYYTVPACIGDACSCVNNKATLSAPMVNVTRREGEIIVNWNTSFDTSSDVQLYTISLGIPLLVSRKGLPVYNKTEIGQVSAGKGTFLWNLESNGQYVDIKDGYKVIVIPLDNHGCSGPEGGYIINSASYPGKSAIQWHLWFILIAIVVSCIFFGVSSFVIKYRKHTVFMLSRNNDAVGVHRISKCKPQWKETILHKHNILYVGHECETAGSEDESDTLKVPFKSVKLIRELGTGQFGKVYLGHLDDTNRTLVAVKMSQEIDVSIDSETRQQFIKEIEIMRMVGNHPHLIQLIGYCIQPNSPTCILLEYMQGGDLLTYLHRKRKQRGNNVIDLDGRNDLQDLPLNRCVSEALYTAIHSSVSSKRNIYKLEQHRNIAVVNTKDAITNDTMDTNNTKESWFRKTRGSEFLRFATEIAMGMEHLEAKGITHRDLAARNILLSKDSTIKISDFGLSRNGVYIIENIEEKTRRLPIRWMSPEALKNRAFSSKSDVWSFGVLLWEIGTLGAFPYSNVQDDCLLRYIVHENGRLKRPNDVPSIVYDLMFSCWTSDPENRPNFTQLVFKLQTLSVSLNSPLCAVSNPCYTLARPNDTD